MEVEVRGENGLDGKVYAKAGEATYCENGHVLGHFDRDAKLFAMPSGELVPVEGVNYGDTQCPTCKGRTVAATGIYFFAKPQ